MNWLTFEGEPLWKWGVVLAFLIGVAMLVGWALKVL